MRTWEPFYPTDLPPPVSTISEAVWAPVRTAICTHRGSAGARMRRIRTAHWIASFKKRWWN